MSSTASSTARRAGSLRDGRQRAAGRQRLHRRVAGAVIGVHWSLGLSAAALCAGTLAAGVYALRERRPLSPSPLGP